MEPAETETRDERLESVPWAHIGRPPRDSDRTRMVVVAVAVVVAAVSASAARTLWPSPPLTPPVVPQTTLGPTQPDVVLPETSASTSTIEDPAPSAVVSEADLRAVSNVDATRSVAAHAEWFVTEWLTFDGSDREPVTALLPVGVDASVVDSSARSFVESTVALAATEIRPGRWEVEVVVRSLSSFESGDYLRVPARMFVVTVELGEAGPIIADLPFPAPIPRGEPGALDLVPESAPERVLEAALQQMSEAGLPDEASVVSERSEGLWRISGVVRDAAGIPFRVAVWLDDRGEPAPVP